MINIPYQIKPLGDQAVRIEFSIKNETLPMNEIHYVLSQLNQKDMYGVLDIVPGLHTITIFYQPRRTTIEKIRHTVSKIVDKLDVQQVHIPSRTLHIPVLYGSSVGPDLTEVAHFHQTTCEQIIEEHCRNTYQVAMLGFLPGFPYLTGLPSSLYTPRRKEPRLNVDAGAVGIGGEQTGIYPINSPGGWNIIGKTPIPLFDSTVKEPFLFQQGDYVRFFPITEKDWTYWTEKVRTNNGWKKEVILHEND